MSWRGRAQNCNFTCTWIMICNIKWASKIFICDFFIWSTIILVIFSNYLWTIIVPYADWIQWKSTPKAACSKQSIYIDKFLYFTFNRMHNKSSCEGGLFGDPQAVFFLFWNLTNGLLRRPCSHKMLMNGLEVTNVAFMNIFLSRSTCEFDEWEKKVLGCRPYCLVSSHITIMIQEQSGSMDW